MTSSRESVLLRGASAAQARPYRAGGELGIGSVAGVNRGAAVPQAVPLVIPDAVPSPDRRRVPESSGGRRGKQGSTADVDAAPDTRGAEVAGQPAPVRLEEVFADEVARLRAEALEAGRREGHAQGFAEGAAEAAAVVAAAEAAAVERLAEAHAAWERRWATGAAALANAARQLDETAAPVVDGMRDLLLDSVVELVEGLLARELAVAKDPGIEAARRALTFLPADSPVVVRLHPDDIETITPSGAASIPGNVTIVPDPGVERGGALAETGPHRVDAQFGPALDRVKRVLFS